MSNSRLCRRQTICLSSINEEVALGSVIYEQDEIPLVALVMHHALVQAFVQVLSYLLTSVNLIFIDLSTLKSNSIIWMIGVLSLESLSNAKPSGGLNQVRAITVTVIMVRANRC